MRLRKICTVCGENKLRSEYHFRSKTSGWIQAKCKVCHKAAASEWHKNNPGKHTEYSKAQRIKNPLKFKMKAHKARLRHLYGLSLEQFDRMFRSQNGACAICQKHNLNGRRLCIDHDHDTGKVRGLLCYACNHLVGRLEQAGKVLLQRALSYLNWKLS